MTIKQSRQVNVLLGNVGRRRSVARQRRTQPQSGNAIEKSGNWRTLDTKPECQSQRKQTRATGQQKEAQCRRQRSRIEQWRIAEVSKVSRWTGRLGWLAIGGRRCVRRAHDGSWPSCTGSWARKCWKRRWNAAWRRACQRQASRKRCCTPRCCQCPTAAHPRTSVRTPRLIGTSTWTEWSDALACLPTVVRDRMACDAVMTRWATRWLDIVLLTCPLSCWSTTFATSGLESSAKHKHNFQLTDCLNITGW